MLTQARCAKHAMHISTHPRPNPRHRCLTCLGYALDLFYICSPLMPSHRSCCRAGWCITSWC